MRKEIILSSPKEIGPMLNSMKPGDCLYVDSFFAKQIRTYIGNHFWGGTFTTKTLDIDWISVKRKGVHLMEAVARKVAPTAYLVLELPVKDLQALHKLAAASDSVLRECLPDNLVEYIAARCYTAQYEQQARDIQ